MIAVPASVRVVLCTRPVDFRKGHDGLAAVVKNALRQDLFCGDIFIFRSKRRYVEAGLVPEGAVLAPSARPGRGA